VNNLRIAGARDGESVQLPQNLDALLIETSTGSIYIDLGEQVPGMVLIRGVDESGGRARLIASPMESGRLAVGVIKAD
jgi:hypothetical protein